MDGITACMSKYGVPARRTARPAGEAGSAAARGGEADAAMPAGRGAAVFAGGICAGGGAGVSPPRKNFARPDGEKPAAPAEGAPPLCAPGTWGGDRTPCRMPRKAPAECGPRETAPMRAARPGRQDRPRLAPPMGYPG